MLVRFRHTGDLVAETEVASVTWRLPAARQTGEASLVVRRDDPAFSAVALNPRGGFLVEILGGSLGTWTGIGQSFEPDAEGASFTALQEAAMAERQGVSLQTTHIGLTAGTLARMAVYDAIAGDADTLLRPGVFTESAPIVDAYTFAGKSLATVLDDLLGLGGGEWRIDAGKVSWLPVTGTFHAPVVDGGGVWDVRRDGGAADQVAEVVAVGDAADRYVARAREVAGANFWRTREVITVATRSVYVLQRTAEARLFVARQPSGRLSCRLDPRLWTTIREGDFLRIVAPYLDIGGSAPLCRVLGRTYSERDESVTLELQEVSDLDIVTAIGQAGARSAAPPAPTLSTQASVIGALAAVQSRVAVLTGRS